MSEGDPIVQPRLDMAPMELKSGDAALAAIKGAGYKLPINFPKVLNYLRAAFRPDAMRGEITTPAVSFYTPDDVLGKAHISKETNGRWVAQLYLLPDATTELKLRRDFEAAVAGVASPAVIQAQVVEKIRLT